MIIKRFVGGNLESNGYVLYIKDGGTCFVVDPGYNPERFLTFIQEHQLRPAGILLTHHHYDHVGGVDKIRNFFDCPVYLHRGDVDLYRKPVDVILEGGEQLDLDGEKIDVIHTPGHTSGGVCYYSEKSKAAFTGDTIFNVDLGRTDLEGGSFTQLQNTVVSILDKWSNDITIHPGHGDPCNMKYVRNHNEEFLYMLNQKV